MGGGGGDVAGRGRSVPVCFWWGKVYVKMGTDLVLTGVAVVCERRGGLSLFVLEQIHQTRAMEVETEMVIKVVKIIK